MRPKILAREKFRSNDVYQTLNGICAYYVDVIHIMQLKSRGGVLWIEWTIIDSEFFKRIIIYTEGKRVVDYDNVYCLPDKAIQLLKKAGYDTSAVED